MKRTNKRQKINKHQSEIKVDFSAKNISPFGGLGLFRKLVQKLGVEKALESINPSQANENGKGGYTVGEKVMSLIYGLVLDLERPADTEVLKRDKVFQAVIGYGSYPDQSIFSRFLRSFSVSGATEIGDKDVEMLLQVRHNFRDWSNLTFDMDSHVKTVYGNQQRAKVGYNPKKRGRKSYHPLFCFIGETRDFLLGKFRSGNKNSISGAIELLRDCLRLVPKHIRQLYLRADSGFFSFDYLSFLEKHWIKYAVVAKLYGPIQMQLGGLKYRDIGYGVEVSEFAYCAFYLNP